MNRICPLSRQRAVVVAIAVLAMGAARAADDTPSPAPASTPATIASSASGTSSSGTSGVQSVVITGNPLRAEQLAAPATSISGDELVLRRGSSLGETLEGLPGVSSTYFGPNANRPVIRGQDGDRIRVLSNAGASLDASSLSFDHAVPIDPLVVERVEVLRGPAALLYGGSAVGGVVNAIDNRIPRSPVSGVSGAAEARMGGAADERGVSGLVEAGGSGFALHADAFWRKTDDLRVPGFDRPVDGGGTERRDRVVNSASEAKGGAVGGSMVWDHGFLGASVDTYRNDYGTVAEEDVTIRMQRDKLSLSGEVRDLGGFITTVRAQAGFTNYEHQEVEGTGEVGTTFKNKGGDLRVEAVHAARALGAGQLEGVFGFQGESSRFEALGEEAFVPTTHSRQAAAFVYEQWSLGKAIQLSGGLRAERATVDSDGDADADAAKFGPALQRSFSPKSASLGAVWNLDTRWQLSGNAAYTERAPTSYELYANGVHAATATFERGDTAQAKERGRNIDLALQWKDGHDHAKVGAFWSRFQNYIALVRSSEPDFVDEEGNAFPVYTFRGVPARLYGAEVDAGKRLWQGAGSLDLEGHIDLVRGDNLSTGEPLPRIAPLRATVALYWQQDAWSARAEVQHATRQTRVPEDDTPTPAWTIVNLSAAYKLRLGETDALAFVKLNNVGNALAYNASTIGTVRPLSPLPGRGVMAGLRVSF
ncbi:TonB-dependent receptor [Ideonella sp. BN130291]|uniref:TonB-dependent receptor n=1 Tax=Ideonella sp. BN130291 TaxID=3112940 RepID=UPI002E2663CE|nr:TonB-dependent receptor [Ideonella sp. BN130291]